MRQLLLKERINHVIRNVPIVDHGVAEGKGNILARYIYTLSLVFEKNKEVMYE